MKFTRRKRIAIELLGPGLLGTMPILGTTLWTTAIEGGLWKLNTEMLQFVGVVLLFGYAFAGVQSIAYAVIMEWRFSRGLDPRSWRMVGLSTVLGSASGAVIILAMGKPNVTEAKAWLVLCSWGLIVGFVLGLSIKGLSGQKKIVGEKP